MMLVEQTERDSRKVTVSVRLSPPPSDCKSMMQVS